MSRAERGRRPWEIPVLLGLAVVIVAAIAFNLANLETSEGSTARPPALISRSADAPASDPRIAAILWAIEVVVFGLIVLLLFRHRRRTDRRPLLWWGVLPSLLGVILFLFLLSSVPQNLASPRNATTPTPDGSGSATIPAAAGFASGWPAEAVLLITIFGTILGIVYGVRLRPGPSADLADDTSPGPGARAAATGVLEETIRDLEIGTDVRAAILACFERFCRLLRSRGIEGQDPLTAREIEGLAVRTLAVSPEASESLTSLFEEARYSVHALGEVDRRRAIESLGRIRAALEA